MTINQSYDQEVNKSSKFSRTITKIPQNTSPDNELRSANEITDEKTKKREKKLELASVDRMVCRVRIPAWMRNA